MLPAGSPGDLGSDAGIGVGGAEGDGEHNGGDHLPEVGALDADRWGETRVGALEVGVEPLGRLCEDGQMGRSTASSLIVERLYFWPSNHSHVRCSPSPAHGHGAQG